MEDTAQPITSDNLQSPFIKCFFCELNTLPQDMEGHVKSTHPNELSNATPQDTEHHTSEIPPGQVESTGEHPNLIPGDHGMKLAEKWKTPEERIIACEQYCQYLRNGRDKKYYPEADENTIERYIKLYPQEFRPEKIADAERAGLATLDAQIIAASVGKLPGAVPSLLIWRSKNKMGWREKIDHTTDGKAMPQPIAGGQSVVHTDSSDEQTS